MGERRGGNRQAGRGRKGKWAEMGDVHLERPDPLGLTRLMVFCVLSWKDSAVRLQRLRESSAKAGSLEVTSKQLSGQKLSLGGLWVSNVRPSQSRSSRIASQCQVAFCPEHNLTLDEV